MFMSRSACSERGGIGLTAEHDLPGKLELLAAHGIEHLARRLAGTLAPPVRPLPPLDHVGAGARVPDPAVALAGQGDKLPATGGRGGFF